MLIYGTMYLVLGLFFGQGYDRLTQIFPLPVLGVLLLFEGLAMLMLVRDLMDSKKDFSIAILVGVIAVGLPYGYLIGMVVGTLLSFRGRELIERP